MTKSVISLDDKYVATEGRVMISSIQALVRLPMDQVRRDRAAGLATTGFITGYRGSPLTTYDAALWSAQKWLDEYDIRFHSGLNEELAATSLRGAQQLAWFGQSRFSGAFGIWYGKGVGVDRASEALKLGNLEGSSSNGGVLVVAGDDHAGKSSASAHQSEQTLAAGFIPVLYPATTDEIIEYGLFGFALSRYSGLWVALKTITDTLDLTSSVDLPNIHRAFATPADSAVPGLLNLTGGRSVLEQEALTVERRLPAAAAFVRYNGLDRIIIDSRRRELAIVTAGKAYLDVLQALSDLGIDEERAQTLGIRIFKVGMVWPLERSAVTRFCAGSREVLVVEEKRAFLEEQLTTALYHFSAATRPSISGKRDPSGAMLLPSTGVLSPSAVRKALYVRLSALGLLDAVMAAKSHWLESLESMASLPAKPAVRPPYMCSGCPHNTSTAIPDGSAAMGATGCHGLVAVVMPERRTMGPVGMGAEGMPWVAAAPLVDTKHMFQNMGDGTFLHSGILAIRAAVIANINVTYKILYNDAVAMTGGQPLDGNFGPIEIVAQLAAENVKPIVLVTDDPDKYRDQALAGGTTVKHRDYLDSIQKELRELAGVNAIVYDQTCAAEKRRRRKRKQMVDPDRRLFINADVCEGCGDCSAQSNCMSVQPHETEFGRKRSIDQSSCNKDFSCIKGFCPSFVSVTGAKIGKRPLDDLSERIASLPAARVTPLSDSGYAILVGGIGGTGVLTVGAIIAMAAHLEGKASTVLDMTGMAQKGGAVTSHIRIARRIEDIRSRRLSSGMADLLLGCDLVVTAGAEVLGAVNPSTTKAVLNTDVSPTGAFQRDRHSVLDADGLMEGIVAKLDKRGVHTVRATELAQQYVGDSIATNLLMVGYAAQLGFLPVAAESIEHAIRLNGVMVESNLRVLSLGRLFAHDEGVMRAPGNRRQTDHRSGDLDVIIESRSALLTSYQDSSYAKSFQEFVTKVRTVADSWNLPQNAFAEQVAITLARLMAYKDEYEVARLHSAKEFFDELSDQFQGDFKLTFHLAPPLLARIDPKTGRPRKIAFGAWIIPVFKALARLKGLRGTRFDLFGYTRERRMERALIEEYRALIDNILPRVSAVNIEPAGELAAAALQIAGYGPVKDAAVAAYRSRVETLLVKFNEPLNASVGSQARHESVNALADEAV